MGLEQEGSQSELKARNSSNRDDRRSNKYDGPGVDINFVSNKPAKYDICEQYFKRENSQGEDVFKVRACEFGRDEAERMAERFAGGHGRVQGFLRGYSWSMHKMSRLWENNQDEIQRGAASIKTMDNQLRIGVDEGNRTGGSNGVSRGQSDAISRFQEVMNKGQEPDPWMTVILPEKVVEGSWGKELHFIKAWLGLLINAFAKTQKLLITIPIEVPIKSHLV